METVRDHTESPARQPFGSAGGGFGPFAKLGLLALANAFGVYTIVGFLSADDTVPAVLSAVLLVAVDWIYLRGSAPSRFLAPILVMFTVYQLFVLIYTFNVSFTNSGDGHIIDKSSAIERILRDATRQLPGSDPYQVQVLDRNGELFLLATAPSGDALVGSAAAPLSPAPGAVFDDRGKATSLDGYESLTLQDLLQRQEEVTTLAVPFPALADDATLRTSDARRAFVFRSSRVYDEATDEIRDVDTGEVFIDNGKGNFAGRDGQVLRPGWRANIGFDNFSQVIRTAARGGLASVLTWNLSFALSSTVLSFAAGTFLALVLNHPGMRSRRFYRTVMILPYAFPFFLSGLIWSGLLNARFGFINQALLGGAEIQWLGDPMLARMSVILVSVWFGYPYFFLVSTGALQAIPSDVIEAARADGATGWQTFWRVQFPLLLTAVSPLLVAGFVFSFNDFNSVFMLTGGGPPNLSSEIGAGATDILITLVFQKAFTQASADYGLASAFTVVLFLIVAVMAVVLFRRTRRFEEAYQ